MPPQRQAGADPGRPAGDDQFDLAASERWYAAQIVPGVIQTEDYAREIVRSGSWTYPPGEIERRVQVRMNRQRILVRAEPVALAVVLDEAVLYHRVGGPQVMRAQLQHLAEVSGRPNVDLQVLPNTAGAHPAVHGEFAIVRSRFVTARTRTGRSWPSPRKDGGRSPAG